MLVKFAHRIANLPLVKRTLTENRTFVRLYFNWRYRKEDPYNVRVTEDEKRKYGDIVKMLERAKDKYENILEIGCGEGHLTRLIADKADKVVASDISDIAIGRVKKNCAGMSNVRPVRFDIFNDDPGETFELLLCSEVLFYFEPDQLPKAVERIISWVKPGGYVALAHTLVISDDGRGVDLKKFGARTIHGMFIDHPDFTMVFDDSAETYRVTMVQRKK